MKDSYSLDVSNEALQESYAKHVEAYNRFFERCGLDYIMVQGDSGMMGGDVSHEYMAFSEAGEDDIVFCRDCGYAANVETAVAGADSEAALRGTPKWRGGGAAHSDNDRSAPATLTGLSSTWLSAPTSTRPARVPSRRSCRLAQPAARASLSH